MEGSLYLGPSQVIPSLLRVDLSIEELRPGSTFLKISCLPNRRLAADVVYRHIPD